MKPSVAATPGKATLGIAFVNCATLEALDHPDCDSIIGPVWQTGVDKHGPRPDFNRRSASRSIWG